VVATPIGYRPILIGSFLLALTLSTLWATHIVIWATRRVASESANETRGIERVRSSARRRFVLEFARAVIFSATVTAIALGSRKANAAACSDCCCDTGTGIGNSRYTCTTTDGCGKAPYNGTCVADSNCA
jgi:hypothetical protein